MFPPKSSNILTEIGLVALSWTEILTTRLAGNSPVCLS